MLNKQITIGKPERTASSGREKKRSATVKPAPSPRDRGYLRLAHQHILGQIVSGQTPAGAVLSELSLATKLGLSRTPVREAMAQLVAEGILQKSSRGSVVAEPTRQDIIELYELREALEVYAIGKVAERSFRPRELQTLEELVDQARRSAVELKARGKIVLEGEALNTFVTADMRFHMLLFQAGGNQRMVKLLESTNLLLRVFTLKREHHTVKLLEEVHDFHRRILAAVVSGDGQQAMRLLGEHIRLSRDERLAEYEERRPLSRVW